MSRLQELLAGLSTRNKVIASGVVAVVAAGTVTAVAMASGSENKPVAQASSTPSPTVTAAPKLTPTPKPKPKPVARPVNPFTGIGPVPGGPVIAVKIEDTVDARPQVGLDKADIVYIEQVEGGLTRMAAIFATNKPLVEPVRSVRASDSELLTQYGKIALVASGGGGTSLPTLDSSGLVGVINDRGGPGFGRDGNRPAPHNLTSDLSAVSSAVKAAGARDVGFHWSAADPRVTAGPPAPAINTVVGGTPVSFVWDRGHGRYIRTVAGQALTVASGATVSTPNVLVQFCQVVTDYGDVDVAGNPSAMTKTIGSGRVVLFRNGHRVEGKWSRASAGAPTSFTDLKGKPLLLAPGGTYVVLAGNGAPV
jgi:hypothetical protein